ncbi:(deoxy)nucleoside triphosphate pyrophosphohydrolase [Microbacterium sp. bgisy189]|uniref:(deoxy)nucleoside triphosphate pyrophosphohydrolase n=1 Tax=Microbacterium sp. bgisy189 TaxID=3413798 RepID=UPI003EB8624E
MTRPLIPVVGAVIERDGLVLCARRGGGPLAGWWEFPGGKVEPGEADAEALIREISEELACRIAVGEQVTGAKHDAPHVSIELTTYRCRLIAGEPIASEHSELVWLPVARLRELAWAPADLPTVQVLESAD